MVTISEENLSTMLWMQQSRVKEHADQAVYLDSHGSQKSSADGMQYLWFAAIRNDCCGEATGSIQNTGAKCADATYVRWTAAERHFFMKVSREPFANVCDSMLSNLPIHGKAASRTTPMNGQ